MSLLVLLLILALLFGGFGLLVEGLKWLIVLAIVLVIVDVVLYTSRGSRL